MSNLLNPFKSFPSGSSLDWTGAAMVCSFHVLTPTYNQDGDCLTLFSGTLGFSNGEISESSLDGFSNGDNITFWANQAESLALGNGMGSPVHDVDLYKESGTVPVVSFNGE